MTGGIGPMNPWRQRGREVARRLLLAGLTTVIGASAAGADPCAPWKGEPTPLPRIDDSDELLARWASLRRAELAAIARGFEADRPVRARQLWSRVLCFEPGNADALAGLDRVPLVVVHRPDVARGRTPVAVGDAFASLGELVVVPQSDPAALARRAVDRSLSEAAEHVRNARFEEAIASAARGRDAVGRLGGRADAAKAARLETLHATAALALGREDDAKAGFQRALAAKPDLTLDPATTSPKVRRAFDSVRGNQ